MNQTGSSKVTYLGQDRIKPGQRPLGDRHIDGVEVGRKVRFNHSALRTTLTFPATTLGVIHA